MNILFFLISIISNLVFTKVVWLISNLTITILFIASPFAIKSYSYSENLKYYLLAMLSCLLSYHFDSSVYNGIPLGFLKMAGLVIALVCLVRIISRR